MARSGRASDAQRINIASQYNGNGNPLITPNVGRSILGRMITGRDIRRGRDRLGRQKLFKRMMQRQLRAENTIEIGPNMTRIHIPNSDGIDPNSSRNESEVQSSTMHLVSCGFRGLGQF